MGLMPADDFSKLSSQFRQLLESCRELYVSSGQLCAREHPHLLPKSGEHFTQLMDDLHRALLVKIFVTICEADRHWSKHEQLLGEQLVDHLWGHTVQQADLRNTIEAMSRKSLSLKWYSLVRPFDQIAPLRDRIAELETIVVRLANIIARADGPMKPTESAHVQKIQDELYRHLRPIPIDQPDQRSQAGAARTETIVEILHDAEKLPEADSIKPKQATGKIAIEIRSVEPDQQTPAERLEEALSELNRLIGLENIKQELRTLSNFIKVQQQREQAGLPTTDLTLHMVFTGNPGTGKTTVARIVGRILAAMGVLEQGHLIETDRSGLVAEYGGQTGPKTQQKIDEALGGVLFIDEAYSLIAAEGEDPFGLEAVQTLLKRMEDDRERLVVILAGYPNEMQTLIRSNPGLSSRMNRKLQFVDYTPLDLAKIFGQFCTKNHYQLRPLTRARVMVGLDHLHQHREQHFGNGRASRNLFEHAIRLMANRIAEISELSVEQLTILEPEDIQFDSAPAELFANLSEAVATQVHVCCPACDHGDDVPLEYLGRRVRCPKCKGKFVADWGKLAIDGRA